MGSSGSYELSVRDSKRQNEGQKLPEVGPWTLTGTEGFLEWVENEIDQEWNDEYTRVISGHLLLTHSRLNELHNPSNSRILK